MKSHGATKTFHMIAFLFLILFVPFISQADLYLPTGDNINTGDNNNYGVDNTGSGNIGWGNSGSAQNGSTYNNIGGWNSGSNQSGNATSVNNVGTGDSGSNTYGGGYANNLGIGDSGSNSGYNCIDDGGENDCTNGDGNDGDNGPAAGSLVNNVGINSSGDNSNLGGNYNSLGMNNSQGGGITGAYDNNPDTTLNLGDNGNWGMGNQGSGNIGLWNSGNNNGGTANNIGVSNAGDNDTSGNSVNNVGYGNTGNNGGYWYQPGYWQYQEGPPYYWNSTCECYQGTWQWVYYPPSSGYTQGGNANNVGVDNSGDNTNQGSTYGSLGLGDSEGNGSVCYYTICAGTGPTQTGQNGDYGAGNTGNNDIGAGNTGSNDTGYGNTQNNMAGADDCGYNSGNGQINDCQSILNENPLCDPSGALVCHTINDGGNNNYGLDNSGSCNIGVGNSGTGTGACGLAQWNNIGIDNSGNNTSNCASVNNVGYANNGDANSCGPMNNVGALNNGSTANTGCDVVLNNAGVGNTGDTTYCGQIGNNIGVWVNGDGCGGTTASLMLNTSCSPDVITPIVNEVKWILGQYNALYGSICGDPNTDPVTCALNSAGPAVSEVEQEESWAYGQACGNADAVTCVENYANSAYAIACGNADAVTCVENYAAPVTSFVNQEVTWAESEEAWAYGQACGSDPSAADCAEQKVLPTVDPVLVKIEQCSQSVDALAACAGAGQTFKEINDAITGDIGTLDGLALYTAGQLTADAIAIEQAYVNGGIEGGINATNHELTWLTNTYIPDDLYPALGSIYSQTESFLQTTWTWATAINQFPLPAQLPPYPGGHVHAQPSASISPSAAPGILRPVPSAAAGVLQ